jgi:hypothetical protein
MQFVGAIAWIFPDLELSAIWCVVESAVAIAGGPMRSAARVLSLGFMLGSVCAVALDCGDAWAQATNTAVVDALAAKPTGTSQRAAFYAEVARADVPGVKALLDRAAELKDPATKSFALDALLTRYAELDPGAAVAAASKLGPSTNLVALYQAWLRSSPAAALSSLAKLDESQASYIVPSLLTGAGNDQELANEILAAAPKAIADRYVSSSIVRLAEDSPREALERAQEISNLEVRTETVNGVMRAWASRDPRTFLDYLATLDEAARRSAASNGFWYQIASSAPELALDRADLWPPDLRGPVTMSAIGAIAQRDPLAAYARAQQMPQGQERRQLVQQIAQSFAQHDADAALAWSRSLQPPEPEAFTAVVTAIGQKDPLRAFDLAAAIGTQRERQDAMIQVVTTATLRDPAQSVALLDRALALPNNQDRQSLVQIILSTWAEREPARAADWLVANAERAPPGAVNTVASAYARHDLEQAASYASRVPSQLRGSWLNGVAGMYAQANPQAALQWIEQFRGSPEYDAAALAVIMPASRSDPEAAARAAESLSREDYRRSAVMQVASSWAQRDAARAAAWASGVSDPTAQQSAVGVIASMWSQQDPAAARAWVLGLPAGHGRDGALLSLISSTAQTTIPDDSLFAAFSDDRMRLTGVSGTALFISQRDTAAARAFVEAHVADPTQRERMLNALAQMPAGMRAPLVNPVTGAIMMPPGGLPTNVFCRPASAGPCMPGPMPSGVMSGASGSQLPPPGFSLAQPPPPAQAPPVGSVAPNPTPNGSR